VMNILLIGKGVFYFLDNNIIFLITEKTGIQSDEKTIFFKFYLSVLNI